MSKIIVPAGSNAYIPIYVLNIQPEGVYQQNPEPGSKIKFLLYNSDGEKKFEQEIVITNTDSDIIIDLDATLPAGKYTYDVFLTDTRSDKYIIAHDQNLYIQY